MRTHRWEASGGAGALPASTVSGSDEMKRWAWCCCLSLASTTTRAFVHHHVPEWPSVLTRTRSYHHHMVYYMAAEAERQGEGTHDAPSREELVAKTRRRIAQRNAAAELMGKVRKEKYRRYRRRQDEKLRVLDEQGKAERKASKDLANSWLDEVYVKDHDRVPPLRGLEPRLRIAIDLEYNGVESSHKSLGKQLSCVYGLMRKEATEGGGPQGIPSVHLTSANEPMMEVLNIHGAQAWKVHRHEASVFDVFDRDTLVYLSPDSGNTLTELDDRKVYVVGGLVDRNIVRGRSLGRAQQHGVATARLPLKEVLGKMPGAEKYVSSPCLAIDRVVHILMRVRHHQHQRRQQQQQAAHHDDGGGGGDDDEVEEEGGSDWVAALREVFLSRHDNQAPPLKQAASNTTGNAVTNTEDGTVPP